jgi:hypothetical protein
MDAAQENVAGSEALAGGEEFSVGIVKRERDTGLRARTHKGCGYGGVPCQRDDAVEVVQGDAEFCFVLVPDLDGLAVLMEIGTFERDEKGVEMLFHWI